MAQLMGDGLGNLRCISQISAQGPPLQVAAQLLGEFDGVLLESLPGTPLQGAVLWPGKPGPAALTEFASRCLPGI